MGNLVSSDLFRLVIGLIIVLAFSQLNALFLVWLERKVAGHIQLRPAQGSGTVRIAPDDCGRHQARGERAHHARLTDRKLFVVAPVLVFMPVLAGFLVFAIQSGPHYSRHEPGRAADLFLFYDYRSRNPCRRLGIQQQVRSARAIRSVAQNVAYEIPLLLAVLSVILMVHSLRFSDVVQAQGRIWFIFLQPIAGLIYLICATGGNQPGPIRHSRSRIKNWWPDSILSIAACDSDSSFSLNTPTCSLSVLLLPVYFSAVGMAFGLFAGIPGVIWFLN